MPQTAARNKCARHTAADKVAAAAGLEKVKGREDACHCRLNYTKNTFSAPVCREVEVGGLRSAALTC